MRNATGDAHSKVRRTFTFYFLMGAAVILAFPLLAVPSSHPPLFTTALLQSGPPPLQSLDKCLSSAGKPIEVLSFGTEKKVEFTYSVANQQVKGIWSWTPSDNPIGVAEIQQYAVPYRPTAIKAFAPTLLLVAGIGVNNSTTIECWEFGPPTTKKIRQWPSGTYLLILTPGPMVSNTTVFSDPAGAEGPVNYLLKNHGAPGTALVGFYTTMNVYSMPTSPGAMQLQLSGTAFPSSLDPGFSGLLEVDHPTKGFLYFLLTERIGGVRRFFVMNDASCSGTLDGVIELTGTQFVDQGYAGGTPLNKVMEWPPD